MNLDGTFTPLANLLYDRITRSDQNPNTVLRTNSSGKVVERYTGPLTLVQGLHIPLQYVYYVQTVQYIVCVLVDMCRACGCTSND